MFLSFTVLHALVEALAIHVLIELWGCKHLDTMEHVEQTLRQAVDDCGATLMDMTTRKYSPQGVTAVAIIAESHISIHTWPEHNYAAIDIFTCRGLDPYRALPAIKAAFEPDHVEIMEIKRGVLV